MLRFATPRPDCPAQGPQLRTVTWRTNSCRVRRRGGSTAEARLASEPDAVVPASIGVSEQPFTASDGYRRYVIWLLFAVYVFNFVDRQILTILIEPIKQEFQLSDTQLGLLGGLAFAFLYSTLGIPIARLADRKSRVNIIAASLFVWSLFTALTGMARSFTQLLLARVLVGVGEAGCSPAAYSLISDYFPAQKRSTAISIYSMGIYGGVFVGFLIGGQIERLFGWRAAFYVMGLPGLALALVLKLTLREPPRGFSDTSRVSAEPPPFGATVSTLWAKRSFRHLSLAAALHSFVGYGVGGFNAAFLIRSHGMSVAEVSVWLAIASAFGGITGTFLGGSLADRYTRRHDDMRWQLWVPGFSTLLNVPLAVIAYLAPDKLTVLLLMIPTTAIGTMYLGPTFATVQGLVGVRERALAGAVLLLIINLIGLGLGPLLAGVLSDAFKTQLLGSGSPELEATAQGLRYALVVTTCVNLWSAFHYVRGAKTLREDLALAARAAA
jgi:MFS family permease